MSFDSNEIVYTTIDGLIQVPWGGFPGDREPNLEDGWRLRQDGTREPVKYDRKMRRWLTAEQRSGLTNG